MWDVDGNEYVDLHAGFGTMIAGHGHPAIVAAVSERVGAGTHFAQPVPDVIPVAAELARRFGLPMWRFANSGTEATLAAVHLMRAATGRNQIIKVEGSYHGHHDAVQVSVYPDAGLPARPTARLGARARRRAAGIAAITHVVPFGRLDAVRRVLLDHPGPIAGMIIEPVMMNIGVVPPPPGYLDGAAPCCSTPTARCSRSTRSRPASRSRRVEPPSASASCPTSSAWPRRSVVACRAGRSAARPT